MSDWVVALLFAAGVATWVYSKLVRSTGNSTPSQTLVGAGVAGVIAYVFLYTLMRYIFHI